MAPDGTWQFCSHGYGGSASDPKIVEHSGWASILRDLDEVMADKGTIE